MTQLELNQAVARVTGESWRTIAERGFSLVDASEPVTDADFEALTVDWDAVLEACVNALAHREWTRSVDGEVCLDSDRLEVISPGALRNTMTVEKMIAGQRSPRNPIIVDVLRDYGYVDARGMGVRTKIIPLMRLHNRCDPQFEATDDYL